MSSRKKLGLGLGAAALVVGAGIGVSGIASAATTPTPAPSASASADAGTDGHNRGHKGGRGTGTKEVCGHRSSPPSSVSMKQRSLTR